TVGGGNFGMYGYNSACPPNGLGWDVTSQVAAGVNGRTGTTTFGLEAGNEGDAYSWKEFSDTATFSTNYDVNPITPTGPWTSPVAACTTTTPYPVIGKTDLYMSVATQLANDNVAKPLNIEFKITNLGSGAVAH